VLPLILLFPPHRFNLPPNPPVGIISIYHHRVIDGLPLWGGGAYG
jgi:hypothetical protein